jgi:dolichyl-phosphate beta-glucosyltransferase
MTTLSVVIPAHNEETRLPETLHAYSSALSASYGRDFEIVVVANGCSDATAEVATSIASVLPAVRVLNIDAPIGKGGAVVAGFRAARGARILFADADAATDATSLLALAQQLDAHEVVVGSRRLENSVIEVSQPRIRRTLGTAFNWAIRLLFRIQIRDTQCGAKAFRADAAKTLAELIRERGWAFDLDLLLAARRLNYRIAEVPVRWSHRAGSRLRFVPALIDVSRSLARLWFRYVAQAYVDPVRATPAFAHVGGETPARPAEGVGILTVNIAIAVDEISAVANEA